MSETVPCRSGRWRCVRRAVLVLLLLCAGGACSLAPPPVDEVLDATRDARCAAAIDAFRADRADPALALIATRVTFEVADLTVQQALVEVTGALEAPTWAAIVAAEAELPASIRERVLALAATGTEAAQAALDALPPTASERADAQVHLALHLTFTAWANGIVRSLMAGYGPRILAAADAALALDPEWDHGAPLRLKGRFRAQAPWPVGDRDEALGLLQRAVRLAPLPIHHLFLGDLLAQRGQFDEAVAQWRLVLTAEPDNATRAVAACHRELARVRLRAAGEELPGASGSERNP